MLYAAICEDEQDIAVYIQKTLVNEFSKNNIPIEFTIFNDGNKLLNMFNDHYHFDVVFMDIEMPKIDGISICKKIRQINSNTLVVFISNKDELVFSTFEVQPFRFVRKNHYDELLPDLVPALQTEFSRRNDANITIVEPGSGDIFSFDINQIVYIEAQRKNCVIHCVNNSSELKIKLMEIAEQISEHDFIKPHRSYLVNYKFISIIKKNELELTDGSCVPISRNRIDEVKRNFIKYTNRSLSC